MNIVKIIGFLAAFLISSSATAGEIAIGGKIYRSYDEIANFGYKTYASMMKKSISASTLSDLKLNKIKGKFLFITPSLEWLKDRRVVDDSLTVGTQNRSESTQLLTAYAGKIGIEMTWHYFEKMGLVEQFDIADDSSDIAEIEKNYDYVVTLRSHFNGQRDQGSVTARQYEYFVKNLKTGAERKFIQTSTTPVMLGFFERVALQFNDAVKATN